MEVCTAKEVSTRFVVVEHPLHMCKYNIKNGFLLYETFFSMNIEVLDIEIKLAAKYEMARSERAGYVVVESPHIRPVRFD